MKRNKESKARQKIICKYHMGKKEQRTLDEYVKDKGTKYSELDGIILILAVYLMSEHLRSLEKW